VKVLDGDVLVFVTATIVDPAGNRENMKHPMQKASPTNPCRHRIDRH
jgi:hypothetical protein